MGSKERSASRKLFPLVDSQSEIVLGQGRVVNISDILSSDPLLEKEGLQRQFALQVKGHRRRPTKAPQRKPAEGAALGKAKRTREGLEPVVMAEQIDRWLAGNTINIPLTMSPRDSTARFISPVFIAARDIKEILQTLGNIRRIELDTDEENPEIKEVLDEDQNFYGQTASTHTEPSPIRPRVRGPAIHWVEKPPDISELI